MFEVSAVVNARRKKHQRGALAGARREGAQDLEQFDGVLRHRQDLVSMEQARKGPGHDQAVLQDVRDAAGCPQIVLEHQVLCGFRVAHQVNARNMDVNSARHLETDNLAPEVAAGENQRARNLALAQDALRTVDILEKHVESDHALGEPTLQELPFGTGQNARYQIEREEPFRPAIVAVHRESNSLEQKGKIGELAPLIELCRRHARTAIEPIDHRLDGDPPRGDRIRRMHEARDVEIVGDGVERPIGPLHDADVVQRMD